MTVHHIFFDATQGRQLLDLGPAWLEAYCDLYETQMTKLADPQGPPFHLWHHMPPPAYEQTFGLMLEAGETYVPVFSTSSDAQFHLDFGLDEKVAATVSFGPDARVKLVRDDTTLRAVVNKTVTVFKRLEARITLARVGNDWVLAVEGQPLHHVAASGPDLPCSLHCEIGRIAVVSAQSSAPAPAHVFFDQAQGERVVVLERARNPYRFDWGLRSIRINAVFLMAAVLRDILEAIGAGGGISDPALATRIERLLSNPDHLDCQRRFLRAYLCWPRWRPGVAEFPEQGAWDRNSFTNGVLPLSVAVLARLHPEEAEPDRVQHAVTRKASDFFLATKRVNFAKVSKWRSTPWWIKRSANHGMIMMFTYLAATSLVGLGKSDGARFVHELGFRALAKLYEDGSFCEGVHYNGFALAPCLPYFHLLRDAGDTAFEHFLGLMPRTYEWWSLSHDATGEVFANFGDNISTVSSPDRVSVGRFLQSHAREELGDCVDFDKVDAYFPFSGLTPHRPNPSKGLILRLRERNQFAHATFRDPAGQRRSGLFVIGSRMQATHNCNHDGLGFAFYAGDRKIAIDRADRQPLGNNGVFFEDKTGNTVRIEKTRSYSGEVTELPAPVSGTALIQVKVPKTTLEFAGKGGMNVILERCFLYRPEQACPLVLQTRIVGVKTLSPVLAFNLRAPEGEDAFEVHSALLQPDGRWMLLEPRNRNKATLFSTGVFKRRPISVLTWIGRTDETPEALAAYFDAAA
jgi:hypothetical protein